MNFAWAKRYMPRSLYGRAALILLVPVVTLQLVVSVVFIQRHFEGVTEQMARNVALELRFLLRLVDEALDMQQAQHALAEVAGPLAFAVALPAAMPEQDKRAFYDFSGLAAMETFRMEIPGAKRFDFSVNRQVWIWIETRYGVLSTSFDRRRVSASNPHQLLVLMVVTGLLMTLISFIFLRNQLRPIKRLARASEAFGKGRVESYRSSGAIEVRAAGQAFLDMRARILRQIEQRTMMLSGVSHDMRTPLTRLRLGLSILGDSPEAAELERDIKDMQRLLDEFLAFARDDSLDDPEPADPEALVRGVVEKFDLSDGTVRIAEVKGEGPVVLRPMAVSRALENLIGNGIRYGTRCEIRLSTVPRAVRITVEDDGPGIPAGAREDALRPFVRLDAARNQDRGSGVGLGLSIANDIARRHGGSLVLGESEALGGLKAELILAR